jgi:hypothetical protein
VLIWLNNNPPREILEPGMVKSVKVLKQAITSGTVVMRTAPDGFVGEEGKETLPDMVVFFKAMLQKGRLRAGFSTADCRMICMIR